MRAVIFAAVLALVGCTSTPEPTKVPDVSNKITYEPPMPKPLEVCDVHWEVLIVDNKPYVALTYEDNVNFAVCAKDLEKYISELTLVVCQYRQCSKEQNDPTTIIRSKY